MKNTHKKTSSILKTITTTALLLVGSIASAQAGEYQLSKHRIEWSGSMPAKTHSGLLTPSSVTTSISDSGEVESLNIVVDMESIDVTDITGSKRKKLTKHLKSDDFFDVKNHPTASFKFGRFSEGKLYGTIEIRGIEQPIEVPAKVVGHKDRGWILSSAFTFDRQKFNVNYQNGGLFGAAKNKLIRDEIEVDIELTVVP